MDRRKERGALDGLIGQWIDPVIMAIGQRIGLGFGLGFGFGFEMTRAVGKSGGKESTKATGVCLPACLHERRIREQGARPPFGRCLLFAGETIFVICF
mmetsp:Transcript_25235/g.51489  ORF Transcript_25235/g.51489 Transcript_25235/m.51489 type:complete len:98 (+) Transcript_25235:238-531(+)